MDLTIKTDAELTELLDHLEDDELRSSDDAEVVAIRHEQRRRAGLDW